MPVRGVDTGFWSDSFIQKLPFEAKGLYLYLWTNDHCNAAGLYEITIETIAFETKIPSEKLPGLLHLLEPKVAWYEDGDIIWVRNFLKRQTHSPKFLVAAARAISGINRNGLVKEFLKYNAKFGIAIPYQYLIDKVPIPAKAISNANANTNSDPEEGDGEEPSAGEEKRGSSEDKVVTAGRARVFELLKKRRDYNSPSSGAEAQAITWMLKQGYTVEQIIDAYDQLKRRPFWHDNFLNMQSVKKNIGELVGKREGEHEPPEQRFATGFTAISSE